MTALTSPPVVTTTERRRLGARINWTVMALLSLAVVGYVIGQYATESLQSLGAKSAGVAPNYAHRPFAIQVTFYVHIVAASLTLATGPFQFIQALRRRRPAVHRWIGRVYLVATGFAGVAGLVMAFVSRAGIAGFFGFGGLAVLWLWTGWRGYRAIRERDVASHRAWMIRSFAVTFAAVTLRLWLGLLIGAQVLAGSQASGDRLFMNAYVVVPFLSWLPNVVVAELMIRRRDLPGLRYSTAH
jgi:uncharacterized membrane protein